MGHWERFFTHLMARLTAGPLHLRLYLQPAMAILLAVRDGIRDARENRQPFLWSIAAHPSMAKEQLRSAFRSIGKVFLMAIVIDAIYQLITVKWFYPGEALWVAFVLAFWPYVLTRGPAYRVARLLQAGLHRKEGAGGSSL